MVTDRPLPAVVEQEDDDKESKPRKLQTQLDNVVTDLSAELRRRDVWLGFGGDKSWYVYEAGFWRRMATAENVMISRMLDDLCQQHSIVYAEKHSVVWRRLETAYDFAFQDEELDQRALIAVHNGTLNVETGELEPHSPEAMTTRFAAIEFDPDATCPKWLDMLDGMFDNREPETRRQIIGLIQEWMGIAVAGGSGTRTPRALRKALFLYGPPRAGKSTISDVMRALIGTKRIVTARVADLTRTYGMEAFLGAAAWVTEEVEGLGKIADPSRVKCIITGEPINVPRKYMTDAVLEFRGPILWAGNTRPNFPESSDALYTRVLVIETARVFTESEARAKFGNLKPIEWLEKNGELPGIFVWALEGYKRLLERGHYEDVADLQEAGESWREQNDAVFAFLKECCELDEDVMNVSQNLAWAAFQFAKSTRNEFIKVQTLRSDIRNAIPTAFPSVKAERIRRDDGRRWVYTGLKLNRAGLAYLKKAKADNDGASGETAPPNEPVLGR